eukprot:scaffold4475_cov142-Skeletonema_marinoi.AAC.8
MIALEFHSKNSPEEASCRALAKCIHSDSVHYHYNYTRCGMKSFAILTSSARISHLRPRHEARRNARVESTSDSSSYVVVGLVIKRRAIDQSSAGSSYLLAEVGQQI